MTEIKSKKMTLEEVLRSPQFKQALFEVQVQECERLLDEMQQADFSPLVERSRIKSAGGENTNG